MSESDLVSESDTEVEIKNETEQLIPDDDRAWYVVHCYSGYENKVRHSIEQRIETMGMQPLGDAEETASNGGEEAGRWVEVEAGGQ